MNGRQHGALAGDMQVEGAVRRAASHTALRTIISEELQKSHEALVAQLEETFHQVLRRQQDNAQTFALPIVEGAAVANAVESMRESWIENEAHTELVQRKSKAEGNALRKMSQRWAAEDLVMHSRDCKKHAEGIDDDHNSGDHHHDLNHHVCFDNDHHHNDHSAPVTGGSHHGHTRGGLASQDGTFSPSSSFSGASKSWNAVMSPKLQQEFQEVDEHLHQYAEDQRSVARSNRSAESRILHSWPRSQQSQRPKSLAARVVTQAWFEVLSGVAIIANVIVMALEMQYKGFDVGYQIGAEGFSRPARDVWPGADISFSIMERLFFVVFCVELLIRCVAAGPLAAPKNKWLWFDGSLVAVSFLETFLDMSNLNPNMMRVLRLLRLARMVRLARDLGALQALYLILKSIEESIGALCWSFIVLFFMQLAVGMGVHQVLTEWIKDEGNDINARRRIFEYWGTFSKTTMTMFEITLANWVITCRRLMTDVSEYWALFYVVYQCMICFAALKVITAVFIAQTNRAVARDDDLVTMMEEEQRKLVRRKLEEMFESLDESHDGYLTWEEFEKITENTLWRSWGEKLGIPMSDLWGLFELLAGDDGKVSSKEFFSGLQRVKGPAKALDLVWLLSEFNKVFEQNSISKHEAASQWQHEAGMSRPTHTGAATAARHAWASREEPEGLRQSLPAAQRVQRKANCEYSKENEVETTCAV